MLVSQFNGSMRTGDALNAALLAATTWTPYPTIRYKIIYSCIPCKLLLQLFAALKRKLINLIYLFLKIHKYKRALYAACLFIRKIVYL